MTLKSRLTLVVALLCAVAIGIGLLGLYGMQQSDDALRSVYQTRTVALEQVSRIDRLLVQSQLALAEAMQDSMVVTINKKSALIEKNAAEIDQAWARYLAGPLSAEERQLAGKFADARAKLSKDGLFAAMAAMRAGDLAQASQLQEYAQSLVPAVRDSVDALRKLQVDAARDEYASSRARYQLLRSLVSGAIGLGALLAAVLGLFLVKAVYRQLGGEPDYAAQVAHRIAGGDLAGAVTLMPGDTGSLLAAMASMQQNLSRTVGDIRISTDAVASASSQIAAGNMDLSARTEQQASALEETAASLAVLTGAVKQNADSAQMANALVLSSSESASKGSAVVAEVVRTMGSINASSVKIADITSVIDGIAFQTNILALNAAVEAARAGEQGRGFAVVAAEVRQLAQRSAEAARQIKDLIGQSIGQVDSGNALVQQAGATMQEIVDRVTRVTRIMGQISVASHEQHAGIEQVNQALGQMDQVTQQNAALVEEAAAGANALREQAGQLAHLVAAFTVEETAVRSATVTRLPLRQPAPRLAPVQAIRA